MFSVFVWWKVTINENVSFTHHAFGIQLVHCSKLGINWKNDNDIKICRHDVIIKFLWHCCIFLVMFSYWSKFHVNIITCSGVRTAFIYKGLTGNPKTRNTPVWNLSNIWRLGRVMDINMAQMSIMKSYWMLQNIRATAFTVSELLKEKQQVKLLPHPDYKVAILPKRVHIRTC